MAGQYLCSVRFFTGFTSLQSHRYRLLPFFSFFIFIFLFPCLSTRPGGKRAFADRAAKLGYTNSPQQHCRRRAVARVHVFVCLHKLASPANHHHHHPSPSSTRVSLPPPPAATPGRPGSAVRASPRAAGRPPGPSVNLCNFSAGMGKKDDPKLMQEWFKLVQEKNALVRYESELMIL